ncbi:MAG TPA: glycosyl hydrolase family 28-related protein [Mycobacteriales bacterium]
MAADVLLFGADPPGRRDAAPAFDRAIAFARTHHLPVYVPPGRYQVNRHIVVDDVTITGAGSWYTIVRGREVALSTPDPDGSVRTGGGFSGRPAGRHTSSHLEMWRR